MHLKYSGYDVTFYTTTLRLTMPRQLTSLDYENTVYGFVFFFVVALFRVQEDRKKSGEREGRPVVEERKRPAYFVVYWEAKIELHLS